MVADLPPRNFQLQRALEAPAAGASNLALAESRTPYELNVRVSTDAFTRRPLSRASRSFIGPILKGSRVRGAGERRLVLTLLGADPPAADPPAADPQQLPDIKRPSFVRSVERDRAPDPRNGE